MRLSEVINLRSAGITMSKRDFIEEHRHLVNVLRNGSKSDLAEEAADQAEELSEVEAGGPGSGRRPGFGGKLQDMIKNWQQLRQKSALRNQADAMARQRTMKDSLVRKQAARYALA